MRAVKAIAPVFGGINLEDTSAPRCFEIEDAERELDIVTTNRRADGGGIAGRPAQRAEDRGQEARRREDRVRRRRGASAVAAKLLMVEGARNIAACNRTTICAGAPRT